VNKYGTILFSTGRCQVSVASEYEHAEQVVADVALLHDMAAGRLDQERVREAAEVLLEHRRSELPGVSVAVAARLLGVSRTTVEAWREAGILTPAPAPAPAAKRRRHEITIDSLVRLQALIDELRRLGRTRELRDYVWWSGQDAADYADGKVAEALRQLRAGELGDEYVPSDEDLEWARRELDDPGEGGES
jgi:Homeodomain-like domain